MTCIRDKATTLSPNITRRRCKDWGLKRGTCLSGWGRETVRKTFTINAQKDTVNIIDGFHFHFPRDVSQLLCR